MSHPQVLFLGDLDESLPQFQEFQQSFDIIHYKLSTKQAFLEKLPSDFNKVEAIYAGWLGFASIGGLTKDIIEQLPDSLKVISITSVGHDQYDTVALKAKGIKLYNTPSLGAEAVADTVLWHVLESFRHFSRFQSRTRQFGNTVKARNYLHANDWDFQKGKVVGDAQHYQHEYPFGEIAGRGLNVGSPIGKVCGIVGFGTIGKAIGRRLKAIGMEIKYHQRNEIFREAELELGYEVDYVENLKDLVKVSDVVILSLPGNAVTKGIISEEVLDSFKRGGKLINVGRGILLESEGLVVDRLETGALSFYGADVFVGEPTIDSRLLERDDVSLTPHIGSSTKENFDNTAIFALSNISAVLKGEVGESLVC
jgi:gluconate 2-dehydrogenase